MKEIGFEELKALLPCDFCVPSCSLMNLSFHHERLMGYRMGMEPEVIDVFTSIHCEHEELCRKTREQLTQVMKAEQEAKVEQTELKAEEPPNEDAEDPGDRPGPSWRTSEMVEQEARLNKIAKPLLQCCSWCEGDAHIEVNCAGVAAVCDTCGASGPLIEVVDGGYTRAADQAIYYWNSGRITNTKGQDARKSKKIRCLWDFDFIFGKKTAEQKAKEQAAMKAHLLRIESYQREEVRHLQEEQEELKQRFEEFMKQLAETVAPEPAVLHFETDVEAIKKLLGIHSPSDAYRTEEETAARDKGSDEAFKKLSEQINARFKECTEASKIKPSEGTPQAETEGKGQYDHG